MAQEQQQEIEHYSVKDAVVLGGSDGANSSSYPVDEKDFKNMRLSMEEEDKNKNYLIEMRGWLLTVATLFVNMAFDAMLHPPDWMKTEWYEQGLAMLGKRHAHAAVAITNNPSHAAPTAAVAPSPQPATATASEVCRAYLYLSFNSLTFAISLVAVLLLLSPAPLYHTKGVTIAMTSMVMGISMSLALTFALGTSDNWNVIGIACFALLACACIAAYYVINFARWAARTRNFKSKPKPKQGSATSV